jgi:hypothetical protein
LNVELEPLGTVFIAFLAEVQRRLPSRSKHQCVHGFKSLRENGSNRNHHD